MKLHESYNYSNTLYFSAQGTVVTVRRQRLLADGITALGLRLVFKASDLYNIL